MKARILPVVLCLALLAPAGVTFYYLQGRRGQVRHEVERMMTGGISCDQLVVLTFATRENALKVHWKHAKEFEYQGRMYDIVESLAVGDSTRYWCWSDEEETRLNRQIADLVSQNLSHDPQNRDRQERLTTFLASLYCSRPFTWNPAMGGQAITPAYGEPAAFLSRSEAPPSPPPR